MEQWGRPVKISTTSPRYAVRKNGMRGCVFHVAYKCNRVLSIPKNIIALVSSILTFLKKNEGAIIC
jgi:hypothetical protein